MMKGRDPLHSIRLINTLNLQSGIFAVPTSISSAFSHQPADPSASLASATLLHALLSPEFAETFQLPSPHSLLLSQLPRDATLRPRLFLAAALSPFAGMTYTPPKKKSTIPASEMVIREALKLGQQNHYVDGVPALLASAKLLRDVNSEQFEGPRERSRIGNLSYNGYDLKGCLNIVRCTVKDKNRPQCKHWFPLDVVSPILFIAGALGPLEHEGGCVRQ